MDKEVDDQDIGQCFIQVDSAANSRPENNNRLQTDESGDACSLWSSESGSSTNIRKQIYNEQHKKRMADQMRMQPLPELDLDDFDHCDDVQQMEELKLVSRSQSH